MKKYYIIVGSFLLAFLVFVGIMANYAFKVDNFGEIPIDRPLEATNDKIIDFRVTRDIRCNDLKNCRDMGATIQYIYVTDTEIKPQTASDVLSKEEIDLHGVKDETEIARDYNKITFKSDNGYTEVIYGGMPFAKNLATNKWYETSYATTTPENFNNQRSVGFFKKIFNSMIAHADDFYPEEGTEKDSVDGIAQHEQSGQTFATINTGTGTSASDSGAYGSVAYIRADSSPNTWVQIQRSFFAFDTRSIPAGDTVTAVTLSLYGRLASDAGSWGMATNVYSANPASTTQLAAGDYDAIGSDGGSAGGTTCRFCYATEIAAGSWSTVSYNVFTFNATGTAAVQNYVALGTTTRLGLRESNFEAGSTSPTWSDNEGRLDTYFREQTGTANDPYLSITHGAPPQATPPEDLENNWIIFE